MRLRRQRPHRLYVALPWQRINVSKTYIQHIKELPCSRIKAWSPVCLHGSSFILIWPMYFQRNNEVAVCRTSKARIPSPKSWCTASCLPTATAFGFTERICPANPTSFSQSTRLPYSSMVAFGMHQDCRFATIPVNNREFWKSKIDGNVERDKINIAKLQELGWRVIEIWQCQLKPKTKDLTLQNLLTELRYEQR